MELIEQIKKDLKEILSERRYIHSLGVMEMAGKLAKIHNEDIETTKIAGLLHDIAKEMPKEEMLKYVKENNIETDKIERINTAILHGKIGADIARKRYGVSKQIQDAIKYHTTTSPEMDTLAKIVYVADKTEMNRKSEDYDIEYERKLAKKDLDAVIIYIIDANIKSLIDKNKLIEEESVKTRNSLMIKKLEN
jgi:predicted HD superfamily hydrolase involved in NAD metabolism